MTPPLPSPPITQPSRSMVSTTFASPTGVRKTRAPWRAATSSIRRGGREVHGHRSPGSRAEHEIERQDQRQFLAQRHAARRDQRQAVAVRIDGEAEVGARVADRRGQVRQVRRRRLGIVREQRPSARSAAARSARRAPSSSRGTMRPAGALDRVDHDRAGRGARCGRGRARAGPAARPGAGRRPPARGARAPSRSQATWPVAGVVARGGPRRSAPAVRNRPSPSQELQRVPLLRVVAGGDDHAAHGLARAAPPSRSSAWSRCRCPSTSWPVEASAAATASQHHRPARDACRAPRPPGPAAARRRTRRPSATPPTASSPSPMMPRMPETLTRRGSRRRSLRCREAPRIVTRIAAGHKPDAGRPGQTKKPGAAAKGGAGVAISRRDGLELVRGLEPRTCSLRVSCSTS